MKPKRPLTIGAARGVLEALVLGAIAGVVAWVGNVDLGEWAVFAPGILFLLRTLEGWVDDRVDPSTDRA